MTKPCSDLVAFADGELEPDRAAGFRAHLATCAACRAALLEAIELGARLSAMTPSSDQVRLAPARAADEPAPATSAPVPDPIKPTPLRRRRFAPWIGTAVAATALATVLLVARDPVSTDAYAALETRPYDVRLAYGDAAGYRPTRGELRGANPTAADRVPYAALDAMQKRGDQYGLAIARAWNGENLASVTEQLRKLEPTPAIRSDRAALELLSKSNDNVEPILTELEALKASEDPTVARAARWNYAILLSRLELPLSAAQAFQAIADEHEPGWADEARARGEPGAKLTREAKARWEHAFELGEALVKTGALVPAEVVRQFPGLMRAEFYNAVRAAPSRERVLALVPMAAELDRLDGKPVLGDYLRRIAAADFHRRAPIAGDYARLVQGAPLSTEAKAQLTASEPSDDVLDIVMGAMVELDVVVDHLEAYRRMVQRAGDPWFEIRLAQAEATAFVEHGQWLDAEARLRSAQKSCSSAVVAYQCLGLARQLGELYGSLHRVTEAIGVFEAAIAIARGAGEWGRYPRLLRGLADIERFNASTATARAYANEVLLMADPCDANMSAAHRTLAGAAIIDVDGRDARRDLEAALACRAPDLVTANYLADIGRLDPRPGDLALLQSWLRKLRTGATLGAADRIVADEVEGRLLIESDRGGGTALLERVIAAAGALPRDVFAIKARAAAYSVLVFDAARAADHPRVMRLIAQQLGLAPPASCGVGMVAEDERAVVVVRGADGRDHAVYERARPARAGTLAVPDALAGELDGCAHVQVMAQAVLQGRPRVLPARLAWSYGTGASRGARPHHEPAERRTLIVSNVTPPPELQLPALSARTVDPAPSMQTLSGPAATPVRVLAAMRDASEIEFHTHALVDMGISDASHLVLSADWNGRYALTVEAIRGAELRGQPIVVLAACHSAQGAHYQHAPWSLPDAFLAVGARAVFATTSAVPDLEAGPFFARVLERVRTGADPAAALRDERMATPAGQQPSWVADVIVFE